MRDASMKKQFSTDNLSEVELEAIRELDAMSEEDIDTSDIPEQTDWAGSVRGKFYDPEPQRAARKSGEVLASHPRE